MVYKIEWKLK